MDKQNFRKRIEELLLYTRAERQVTSNLETAILKGNFEPFEKDLLWQVLLLLKKAFEKKVWRSNADHIIKILKEEIKNV